MVVSGDVILLLLNTMAMLVIIFMNTAAINDIAWNPWPQRFLATVSDVNAGLGSGIPLVLS